MEDEVVFGTSGTKNGLVPKNKHLTFFVLSGKLLSYQGFQIMISMGWGGSKFLRLT